MEISVDEGHVETLLAMGFANATDIRMALRLAKNDMNDAVAYLTNEMPGLDDVEMTDVNAPTVTQMDIIESSEFPTTHLYDLEQRTFTANWSIPFKKDESLGRCLSACIKLAQEDLLHTDENACRFINRCLPDCMEKLLNSNQVHKWSADVQEGILGICNLLIDLACAQLQHTRGCFHYNLMSVLCLVLDINSEFHQKNKMKKWDQHKWEVEFGVDRTFGMPPKRQLYSSFCSFYGYLVNLINKFASNQGFDFIAKKFQKADLNAQDMFYLLHPISVCTDCLRSDVVFPVIESSLQIVYEMAVALKGCSNSSNQTKDFNCLVDLLTCAKVLCADLSHSPCEQFDDLRLFFILSMLGSSQFSLRMQGLKEVTKLLEGFTSNKQNKSAIPAEQISKWLAENNVLTLVLEGNIDQPQYCDRLKTLLEFLGPQMSFTDISKIWQLRRNKGVGEQENVHNIIALAAVRFHDAELSHLFSLILKDFNSENSKGKEKLLRLIGRIGKESSIALIISKSAALLWKCSHLHGLSATLIQKSLEEHLDVISKNDTLRKEYVGKCVEDLQQNCWVLPAICHLHQIISQLGKGISTFFGPKPHKDILKDLQNRDILKLLITSLQNIHRKAVDSYRSQHAVSPSIYARRTVTVGSTQLPSCPTTVFFIPATPTKSESTAGSAAIITSTPVRGCSEITPQLSPHRLQHIKYDENFQFEDGFTLANYITAILDFLKFILMESEMMLPRGYVKEIFDCLINDPDACQFEREACFDYFLQSVNDMNSETRAELFQRLIKLDPSQISRTAFACFKQYFDDINYQNSKMSKLNNTEFIVEKQDLIGLDFAWNVALCCYDCQIVNESFDMLINIYFNNLSGKLKKEPEKLHKRFLNECQERLEATLLTLEGTGVGKCLLEASKLLSFIAAPAMLSVPVPDRSLKILRIERLLNIALKYIQAVDENAEIGDRVTVPHGTTFYGQEFTLHCSFLKTAVEKQQFEIMVHSNETLISLRQRISKRLLIDSDRVVIEFAEKEIKARQNYRTLSQLGLNDRDNAINIRSRLGVGFAASQDANIAATELKNEASTSSASSQIASSNSFWNTLRFSTAEQERHLPAVMMAADSSVFEMLHRLVSLEESAISNNVWNLLYYIPSDYTIVEQLDNLIIPSPSTSKSNSLERLKNSTAKKFGSSPKLKSKLKEKEKEYNQQQLHVAVNQKNADIFKKLFTIGSSFSTSFGLLYNLQVLFAKLLPTQLDAQTIFASQKFANDFLSAGAIQYIIKILDKDFLTSKCDITDRQQIYLIVLHILRYLLCGESTLSNILLKNQTFDDQQMAETSTASANAVVNFHMSPPTCSAIKDLPDADVDFLLESLQRLAWAAGGGILHLLNSDLVNAGKSPNSASQSSWALLSSSARRNISESSTGSSDSETAICSLHAAICTSQDSNVGIFDAQIAGDALRLLVDCSLLQRKVGVAKFFQLPHLQEFLIDLLLISSSNFVRTHCCTQLLRLVVEAGEQMTIADGMTPRLVLLKLLMQPALPLWTSTSQIRGAGQRLVSQCSQYFTLRSELFERLNTSELSNLRPSPSQMLEDEANWLLNFTCMAQPSHNHIDNILLAAHFALLRSLLHVLPSQKEKYGRLLLGTIVNVFLFPASKLLLEFKRDDQSWSQTKQANAKLTYNMTDALVKGYACLLELCDNCADNFTSLSAMLVAMHHELTPDLANEWECQPLVEPKMPAGFVGLKNAGATCYMNSVLQQLFLTPNVAHNLLTVDTEQDSSLLYQLQKVFAHLRESDLQYFIPAGFWQSFCLWGQPVNPREQQDAFEFYTDLVDQIDEALKTYGKEQVFKQKFQGVFSDQKMCRECNHKYEREEDFYALNLSVKSQSLEDSLNQFVRGEILEGENAYKCEKCNLKRTAIKRLSIKKLPECLVMHLKRFDYDWEENRSLKFNDYFQFPLLLDMAPYTTVGLQQLAENTVEENLPQHSMPSSVPCYGSAAATTSSMSPLQACGSASAILSPLQRKLSEGPRKFSSAASLSDLCIHNQLSCASGNCRQLYQLVGVLVHSGQASAGHYLSYIKDRRDDLISNRFFGRWFKFNDTTVEHVDMTEQYMQNELFGGNYVVSSDKASSYPEERTRYWNAYMLFYQQVGSAVEYRSEEMRTPRSAGSKRAVSLGVSHQQHMKTPNRRDSLLELAELVEEGEKVQLFAADTISSRIRTEIVEENLRFARDCVTYSDSYRRFLKHLLQKALDAQSVASNQGIQANAVARAAIELGSKFMLNTYLHCKKSMREDLHSWMSLLEELISRNVEVAAGWMLSYLTCGAKQNVLSAFLFDCTAQDVRQAFANFLLQLLGACATKPEVWDSEEATCLMISLLDLLRSEAIKNWQNADAYFNLLSQLASSGVLHCQRMLSCSAFERLMTFLLDCSQEKSGAESRSQSSDESGMFGSASQKSTTVLNRRWTNSQARDFGLIYNSLASLILSCDVSCMQTTAGKAASVAAATSLPMPDNLKVVVFGPLSEGFVKELVWACTHVHGSLAALTDLIVTLSICNRLMSERILSQMLLQCGGGQQSSTELKNLLHLLEQLLRLDDAYQRERIVMVLDGSAARTDSGSADSRSSSSSNSSDGLFGKGVRDHPPQGLLAIIEETHDSDSRHAYSLIKFLVYLSADSGELKEALNQRLSKWQWAVEWLKCKMDTLSSPMKNELASSVTGATGPTASVYRFSNEDASSGRSFQRTKSAQYTLEQATALLSEFEADSGVASNEHLLIEVDEEMSTCNAPSSSDRQIDS